MNAPWVMVAVPISVACVPVALVASSVRLIGLRVVWLFGKELDSGSEVRVDGSSEESR